MHQRPKCAMLAALLHNLYHFQTKTKANGHWFVPPIKWNVDGDHKKAKTKQWPKWRTFFLCRLVFCAKYSWLSYVYCENLAIANHKTEQYSFKVNAAKVTQLFFFVFCFVSFSFFGNLKVLVFSTFHLFFTSHAHSHISRSNKEEKLVDFQFSIALPCARTHAHHMDPGSRLVILLLFFLVAECIS